MTIPSGGPGPDSGRRSGDSWQDQNGVTISAVVRPDGVAPLLAALAVIGKQVEETGEPFARSPDIHYARFVFVPGGPDLDGGIIEPTLMYLSDFDGPVDRHLEEINRIAAQAFGTMGLYLRESVPFDAAGRRKWLDDHVIPNATYYVNTIGRTVGQIKDEARLREEIEHFLDTADLSGDTPEGVVASIREYLRTRPDLTWALEPAPSDLSWRIRRTLVRILLIAIAIPVAIVLLPLILVVAIVLRMRERKDPGEPPRPDPVHVAALAAAEDRTLQNQFSALGFVKPGWFRVTLARIILFIGSFGTRYFFDRESIAGVKTIHFARWIFIDDRRRMLFASNYDGSLENYMGDFIDIVAWGLNAIFSNGTEYPTTRFLVLDGAWNEVAFKRHIRNRQIETHVWYCAYPNLSAVNIAENARFRAALSSPRRIKRSIDWLKLLRRDWGRPADVVPNIEREDMQGLLVRGHSRHRAAAFLLLTFGAGEGGRNAARKWLGGLDLADGSSDRAETYAHIAFTARGLERLGCPQPILDGFSNEFRFGMVTEHRRLLLGDDGASAPESWAWGGPGDEIDGLLLAYARDDAALGLFVGRLTADLAHQGIAARKLDTSFLPGDPFGREHFGFSDGLTTPPIAGLSKAGETEQSIRPGEFFLGYQNEYGRYTARPLVPPGLDPKGILKPDVEGSGLRDFGRNGTYLVVRTMSQDVHRFWQVVDAAASKQPGATPAEKRIRLASKMVGRWPSGAPLTVTPDRDDPKLATKDFMFHGEDREGLRCPVGAHIRRTNPRDMLDPLPGTEESTAVNKRHRLLRRGRTYGPPLVPSMDPAAMLANGDDGVERGLHFICLAANIARQFEFIQASWVNNPQFGGLVDDVDPLIGRRGRFTHPDPNDATSSFTIPGSPTRCRVHDLPDFVTIRGGAYFFMPSLSAVRYLAS